MKKEDVVRIYSGISLSHEKKEITPLAATRFDLEMFIRSEINQTEKGKYMRLFICRIFKKKKIEMNLFTKQKQVHRRRGCKQASEVAQSCPTLCNPMDCSLPGFSVHGILQARILEWVTISFSRGSSQPWDRTWVSRIGGRRFNLWATREEQEVATGVVIYGYNWGRMEREE